MGTVDLRTTMGAAPIQRDVVRVQGPEAVEFLQGQLSQDVAGLAVGDAAWSLLLQPSGKVDARVRATRLGDEEVLLDVDGGYGEAVLARLTRFKLRTRVELTLERWSGLAVRGPGAHDLDAPVGALALPAAWPGVAGVDLISDGELAMAGVALASVADLEALRVESGVPAMGAELTADTIPAEGGQWLIDTSVSFTKGCYTGQELVARVDSRGGNVPHPIRGVVVDGDPVPVGADVVMDTPPADPATVGTVTSSARSPEGSGIALARVGRGATPGTRVELRWGEAPLEHRSGTIAELPLR